MKQMGRRLLALLLGAAMLLSLTGMTPDDSGEAAANSSRTEKAASEPVIDPANAETAAGGETAPAEKKSGAALEEKSEEEPEEELEEEIEEEPEEEPTDDPVSPVLVEGQEFDGEPDADMADGSDMGFAPSAEEGARVEDSPAPAAEPAALKLMDWDGEKMAERSTEGQYSEGADLPAANSRPGWVFKGWYTAEVEHKFYGIGEGEFGTGNKAADFAAFYKVYQSDERYQNYLTKYCPGVDSSDPEAVYEAFYFRWCALTKGEEVSVVTPDVAIYYALYLPDTTYTIKWHHNGWNGLYGALESQVQADGYATAVVGAYKGAAWDNRVFDGWYDKGGNEWSTMEGSNVIGAQPVKADAEYYARWHSSDPEVAGIHVSLVDNGFKPEVDYLQTVHLRAYFDPEGASMSGSYSWTCNDGSVSVKPTDSEANSRNAEVTISASAAEVKNTAKDVVITATFTPDGHPEAAKSASITLHLRHHFYAGQLLGTPNCKGSTQVLYRCYNCGYEYRENLEPLEHQITVRSETPSCTTAGYTEDYCTRCNQVISHTVRPALGHTWNVTTTAGCGGTVTTRTCSVCGTVETTSDPNGAAHEWDTGFTIDRAPTCAADGSQSIHCRNCDATKDSTPIPADPELHVWGEWTVRKAATDTEGGEDIRTCSVCGANETRHTLSGNEQKALAALQDTDLTNARQVKLALNTIVQDVDAANSTLLVSLNALARSDDLEKQKLAASILLQSAIVTELNVRGLVGEELPDDTAQFAASFPGGTIAQYLDASVIVRTDTQFIGLLSETAQPIAIGTELPTGGGPIYQVVREHDGVYETLPTWVENGVLYFSSDKFSTFAVGSSNDITYAAISPIPDQGYTGAAVTPGIQLTINGSTVLTEGRDYTVSYRSNTDIGTATVVITGIGDFTGTREITFRIVVPTGDDQVDGTNVNAAPKEDPPAAGEDEYIVCEACGYHFWEPYLEGWRCTTCGHLRGTTGVPGAAAAAKRSYRGTIPQTADEFPLGGVAAVFVLSLAGLGTVLVLRRKRR